MNVRLFFVVSAIPLLVCGLCGVASAQWVPDGVVVCDTVGDQGGAATTTDGRRGAIIAWGDDRKMGDGDVYVQRLDSAGYARWTANGMAACDTTGDQGGPGVVPDGIGGGIVAWHDYRGSSWDIYAQRVDSGGNVLWQEYGVAVCTYAGEQSYLDMIEDGDGGAIICWNDQRTGEYDIYVQRIDADGNLRWTPDGIPVCTASGWQINPALTTDGRKGAVITWQDGRTDYNIYVQRVDSSGVCRWTADGVALCMAGDVQEYPEITTDGAGGGIIVWQDRRNAPFDPDVYAQRVDSAGGVPWAADGVPICTATQGQYYPRLVGDGDGGAIIVWDDGRVSFGDIYAQRVDSAGQVQWTLDGIPVCDAPNEQNLISQGDVITTDGSGGAIITWTDYRNAWIRDIYAQRLSHDGVAQWDSNGVAVCLADSGQVSPCLTGYGGGGAIIAWHDYRYGYDNADVYAQRVDSAGVVGVAENQEARSKKQEARLLQNLPNPFAATTEIQYVICDAGYGMCGPVTLKVYDVTGRLVKTLLDHDRVKGGEYRAVWEGRDNEGKEVRSGVYFCRLELGALWQVRRMVLVR